MEGFTPGWNDPPKNVKSTGNLKINLNKRVAFPLGSNPPPTQSTATPLLLPPMPPSSLPDPAVVDSTEPAPSDDDLNSKKEKVLSVFYHAVDSLNPTTKPSVASKLNTLEDDWEKSDSELKKLLVEFSEFLEAKDVKNTAAVQRKLILKGTNGQWLHALRQLVMNLETHEDSSKSSAEQC